MVSLLLSGEATGGPSLRSSLLVGSWYHCCELDVATVKLLFERQEASLLAFACSRYSSACDLSGSVIKGIDFSINREYGFGAWLLQMGSQHVGNER